MKQIALCFVAGIAFLLLTGAAFFAPSITSSGNNLLTGSNTVTGPVTFSSSVGYTTNLMPIANAPDFNVPVSAFSTNNVIQFQPCTNVDATAKKWQTCEVWVISTAGAKAIIAPANCKTNGRALSIPFVTNLSIVTFKVYPGIGTNMTCSPVD